MRTNIFAFTVILSLTLLSPVVSAAAETAPAEATAADVTCTVFPPAQIVPGENFDIRVSRVPGYPGSWFAPTITVRVTYPTESGWAYAQSNSLTIPKMGAIRADISMFIPFSIYPDPQGGFMSGGRVKILAIVTEPTVPVESKTLCTATTIMG